MQTVIQIGKKLDNGMGDKKNAVRFEGDDALYEFISDKNAKFDLDDDGVVTANEFKKAVSEHGGHLVPGNNGWFTGDLDTFFGNGVKLKGSSSNFDAIKRAFDDMGYRAGGGQIFE